MWVALDAALVNGPHVYVTWAAVGQWARMEFGPEAAIADDCEWPIEFAPSWFAQDMLPHPVGLFMPCLVGDTMAGLVFPVKYGYQGGGPMKVSLNEQRVAVRFWERNRKRWVKD